jgi:hypothetical protein
MNMDDVEREFWGDQREQPTRVRLARVMKALREEAGPTIRMLEILAAECFPEINELGQKHFVRVVMESAAEEINQILGGDAEAAAGGPARKDGKAVEAAGDKGPVTVNSPAADLVIVDDAGNFTEEQWLSLLKGTELEAHATVGETKGFVFTETAPSAGFFDFEGHLAHQAMWSEATFGPGERLNGVSDHIRKELDEVGKAHRGVYRQAEWIDVVILALDGAWRSGMSPRQIIDGIVAKQRKNEGRTWPDWRTADPNKAIEHDRAKDAPAADVCTWSHPKPGPIGQLVEYERSTCGNPKWAEGYPKWVDGYFENKCQCGRPIYVDLQDPANAWLMESRA